jgi:hypothetical protein
MAYGYPLGFAECPRDPTFVGQLSELDAGFSTYPALATG